MYSHVQSPSSYPVTVSDENDNSAHHFIQWDQRLDTGQEGGYWWLETQRLETDWDEDEDETNEDDGDTRDDERDEDDQNWRLRLETGDWRQKGDSSTGACGLKKKNI